MNENANGTLVSVISLICKISRPGHFFLLLNSRHMRYTYTQCTVKYAKASDIWTHCNKLLTSHASTWLYLTDPFCQRHVRTILFVESYRGPSQFERLWEAALRHDSKKLVSVTRFRKDILLCWRIVDKLSFIDWFIPFSGIVTNCVIAFYAWVSVCSHVIFC